MNTDDNADQHTNAAANADDAEHLDHAQRTERADRETRQRRDAIAEAQARKARPPFRLADLPEDSPHRWS